VPGGEASDDDSAVVLADEDVRRPDAAAVEESLEVANLVASCGFPRSA
jgi:hypothetical protein